MGFFGWLKDKLVDAAVVVTAPIWVPAATVAYGAHRLGKELGLISDDVAKTESLSEANSVQQVEDISNAIRKYYKEYESIGRAKEETAKVNVSNFFDSLIDWLRENPEYADKYADSFGISQIRRKKNQLCDEIDDFVTQAIATKISLDDAECRKILEMKAGDDKKRKMKNFAEKTIQNAQNELEKKVRRVMNQVTDDIEITLNDINDSAEREVMRKQKEFDKWLADIENKNFDSEKAQLEPLVKIYAIERLEKILAA